MEVPDVNFLVIGWYEDFAYYQELKNLVKELQIGNKVIFTEREIDSVTALSVIDISIISSHNEGFSNAIIESMAAGKPVIATNTGGTPEAIRHGYSGILFDPGDARALADAIIVCLKDKKKAEELGRNARGCAEKEFSIEKMVQTTENSYETSLKQAKSLKEWKRKRLRSNPGRMFIRFAKIIFAFFSSYCGVNLILGKTIFRNKFVILAYHKVNDSLEDPLNMAVSISNFEKHIRFIRNKYRVLSLRDLLELVKKCEEIPYNAVAVTFDDGYKDNYINAYPILKQYGVPATIFLAVDSIDNKQILWYERLVNALAVSHRQELDVRDYGLGVYSLLTTRALETVQVELVAFAKTFTSQEREKFIDNIFERLGVRQEQISADQMMLSWENVRQMQKNGCAFESHGLKHTIFSNLSHEELENEVSESRRIISEQTGITPTVLAFPNGQKADFGPEAIEALKKFGYEGACTLESGLNGYDDIFRLKRYCMDNLVGVGVNDRFSGAVFDTTISGIFTLLKK